MNKLELYKRISKIHAIKCSRTTTEVAAITSFNETTKFKNQLEAVSNDNELLDLINSVNIWAGSNPVASDNEIEFLMRNGK